MKTGDEEEVFENVFLFSPECSAGNASFSVVLQIFLFHGTSSGLSLMTKYKMFGFLQSQASCCVVVTHSALETAHKVLLPHWHSLLSRSNVSLFIDPFVLASFHFGATQQLLLVLRQTIGATSAALNQLEFGAAVLLLMRMINKREQDSWCLANLAAAAAGRNFYIRDVNKNWLLSALTRIGVRLPVTSFNCCFMSCRLFIAYLCIWEPSNKAWRVNNCLGITTKMMMNINIAMKTWWKQINFDKPHQGFDVHLFI